MLNKLLHSLLDGKNNEPRHVLDRHPNRGIDLVRGKEAVSGIKILNRLLSLLGLKLKQVNTGYQIDLKTLNDGREKIFAIWQNRDDLMLNSLHNLEYEIVDLSSRDEYESVPMNYSKFQLCELQK